MNLARIQENDIMTGVALDAAGRSDIVDLNGADKFSCQAVYTVDTPVGASITFQGSNDGTNWTNLQNATSISSSTSVFFEQEDVSYRYFSVLKALSSGTVDLQCLVLVVGDAE